MNLLNSLIALIRYYLSLWCKVYITLLKNIEIVLLTFANKDTNNIPR